MNRWTLTDIIKVTYKPIIEDFIKKVEDADLEKMPIGDLYLSLSDTKLNPYTLTKILEDLGYVKTRQDHNGWEMDFWFTMDKPNFRTLRIAGCGITFELNLLMEEE